MIDDKIVERNAGKRTENSAEKNVENDSTDDEFVEKNICEYLEARSNGIGLTTNEVGPLPKKGIETDLKIIKVLVVGFLVVKSETKDGISYVNTIPLDSSWDGFNDDHDLDVGEKVLGIIPAPFGSYKILGLFPRREQEDDYCCGKYQTLGYEYQGTYHPDWNELLEEKIANGEY